MLDTALKLPKIGEVKAVIHRPIEGKVKTVTVTKNRCDQYVDRFFPSSKTCNVCLNQVNSLPLELREWICSHCGTSHDRDINAAINLRDEALRILTCGTRGKAYCPEIRPNRRGRKKSTIGQSVG